MGIIFHAQGDQPKLHHPRHGVSNQTARCRPETDILVVRSGNDYSRLGGMESGVHHGLFPKEAFMGPGIMQDLLSTHMII